MKQASSINIMQKQKVSNLISKNAVLIMLVSFVIIMCITKSSFRTADNMLNILSEFTVYGITALAMTIAIICGEFDLSASSVFAWSTVLFVSMTNQVGPFPALLITIASGIAIGLLNGFLVGKVRISAFVVTLGTMTIVKGLVFSYTEGRPINTQDPAIQALRDFHIGGITITPIIFIVCFVLFFLIMRYTKFGRNIYATGGNYNVAKLSGINVTFYKMIIFVMLGICAAISAILFCVRIGAGSALYGQDLSLYCVSATVIGGTSLAGGSGGVVRTLVGLLVMSVLFNALTLLGVQGFYTSLIRGVVLITVIVIDALIKKTF